MTSSREVELAAWLANIERFFSQGALQLVSRCEALLANYLNVSRLQGILEKNSEYEKEAEIVAQAFQLSLCETDRSGEKKRTKNLTSVFSRVTDDDNQEPEKKHYFLKTESPHAIFPKEEAGDAQLPKLAEQFVKELENLSKTPPKDWHDFIVVFDTLFRKYMWCITASDYEGEDISLYNQSKIAAAIARCIWQYHEEKDIQGVDLQLPYFKLVLCDFSGIQKYIFSVANTGESGVAQRLRARSFYVDMTVSVIAQNVIRKFQVQQNHILLLTGGKFYLLLPNSEDSEELLSTLEKEVEKQFYQMFKGQICLHLAWITIGAEGLENYSDSVTSMEEKLGQKKGQAFYHCLSQAGGWSQEAFIISHDIVKKNLCKSCKEELVNKDREYCDNCNQQTKMGEQLPTTKYIAYYDEEVADTYHMYADYWIGLYQEAPKDNAFLIEQINDTEIPEQLKGLPVKQRYMANHIPVKEDGKVMSFGEIANKSMGVSKLAVLKADVDNLGYIFADGLRRGKKHFGTISRVNTMSRLLEIFFSGYINQLLTSSKYKDVYSVFSGGDDLFLIGPWNIMPDLAIQIADDFREFVAGNPALTISATLSIFQPKEHVASMAEHSEEALKQVKNHSVPKLYPHKSGRNGVSFWGELYSWEDFKEQLAIGKKLAKLVRKREVNIGVLRRIGHYAGMYRSYLLEGDVMSLMLEPLYQYDKVRNYGKLRRREQSDELTWFLEEFTRDLTKNIEKEDTIKRNLYFAEANVAYAMNLTREVRKNGLSESK